MFLNDTEVMYLPASICFIKQPDIGIANEDLKSSD